MSNKTEKIIFGALVNNKDYRAKVLPHLKKEWFESSITKQTFQLINSFYLEYHECPSQDALKIELDNCTTLSEDQYRDVESLIEVVYSDKMEKIIDDTSIEWLSDQTEKYCQDRSILLAVRDSISIIDGEDKKQSKNAIPDILREALSVDFNVNVGHDYLSDADARYDEYIKKENKIQLCIKWLNDITKGGVPTKSLFLWVAPTGVGKTLLMTYSASQFLMQGNDVLYITCEMSETRIAERIDATLMDTVVDDLKTMPRKLFHKKMEEIKEKASGRLVVKEFPPATINANNIRFLLQELSMKKGFKPQVIVIDYLNLMLSSRFTKSENSYAIMKAVAEEIRAIAVEFDILIMTATQTNRTGQNATDFELNEVSESHGISMTADIMIGAISTPELEQAGMLRLKQLKNRFGALHPNNTHTTGCDRPKMKLHEIRTTNSSPQQTQPPIRPASQIRPVKSPVGGGFKF